MANEPKAQIGNLVRMLDFFDPQLEAYVMRGDEVLGHIVQVKLMDEATERPWIKLGVSEEAEKK